MENRPQILDFLQKASAFQTLEPEHLNTLVDCLQKLSVSPGDIIVRQGEPGDRCFLVQDGEVEVIQNDAGRERQVALLGSGSLFGETALLTESPRNATVRATKPTELLALSRSDLLQTLSWNRRIGPAIFDLLQLRDRPIRREDVLMQHYNTSDGEQMTVLKDPKWGTYYRLSSIGQFVWERLDGHHNLKDLALEVLRELKTFHPHTIAEIIGGLVAAGFAKSQILKAKKYIPPESLSFGKRTLINLQHLLTWRMVLKGVDPFFSKFYRYFGFKYVFSRAGKTLLSVISLGGGLVFAFHFEKFLSLISQSFENPGTLLGESLLLFLIIALVHDMGHALMTKHFDREVLGIGIGWNWFSPILYVDTSDMWPTPPKKRIDVHLAGIFTNLFFAGLVSIGAWLFHIEKALLFPALSYTIVLINLFPMFQMDGHYALNDFLEYRQQRKKERG